MYMYEYFDVHRTKVNVNALSGRFARSQNEAGILVFNAAILASRFFAGTHSHAAAMLMLMLGIVAPANRSA